METLASDLECGECGRTTYWCKGHAAKRPAHLDVDRDTVNRRLAMVRQSLDCSAQCCADEVELCLRRLDMSEPFPGNGTVYVALPNDWLQAAAAWVFRGGQYAFGYRTPEGW